MLLIRILRRIELAALVFVWGVTLAVPEGNAQSTKPPQQPLYLPDPTPRERDLHNVFADNPAEYIQRDRSAAALAQQSRTRTLANAKEILLLADQLRDHAAHPDGGPPAPLDRMALQKIERLAKDVRTAMQMQ